jgi:predicted RNA-binding protein with RPS1 domain
MMFFRNALKPVFFVIVVNGGIVLTEIYYGAYKEALFDFALIILLLGLILVVEIMDYYRDLANLLFKITDSQNACIVDLAQQLAKHMPLKDVLAIIEKHGVSIQRPYDDFNNKWPPSNKRKRKLNNKFPQWIKEIKERLKAAVQQPQPAMAYQEFL